MSEATDLRGACLSASAPWTCADADLAGLLRGPAFDGTTVVLVSHDLYFVNAVAQSCIQLQDGKLAVAKGNWDTLQRERSELQRQAGGTARA